MAKHRTFKPEFKARVVLQVLSGAKTAAQVCREHQLKEAISPDSEIESRRQAVRAAVDRMIEALLSAGGRSLSAN